MGLSGFNVGSWGVLFKGSVMGFLGGPGFGVPDLFSPMAAGGNVSPGGSRVRGGSWGSLDSRVLIWGSLGDQESHVRSLEGVMGVPGHLGPFYGHGVGVMRVPVCHVPCRDRAWGCGVCVWFWWSLGGGLRGPLGLSPPLTSLHRRWALSRGELRQPPAGCVAYGVTGGFWGSGICS